MSHITTWRTSVHQSCRLQWWYLVSSVRDAPIIGK